MASSKKRKPSQNLAAGRPPTFQRPKSISRKATKRLINTHHVLTKRKQQAIAKGDQEEVATTDAELSALGGIEAYQRASLQGQRLDRGGDSSRVLLDWLRPAESSIKGFSGARIRMLEVGALSIDNACSKSGRFSMERIDLNSQGEGILRQDFMERPLPKNDEEKFDVISLSLVLNYVPEPQGRGEMLLRTLKFLCKGKSQPNCQMGCFFPCLFLVLPAPCVSNSRYMDEGYLESIMKSLGYIKLKSKASHKLVYYLWKWSGDFPAKKLAFAKQELRSGSSRNNFSIVMR